MEPCLVECLESGLTAFLQVRDQLSDMLQEADSARWPYSGVS